MMAYLVKSKVHKKDHWFAGTIQGRMTHQGCVAITPIIFDAVNFYTRDEAEELMAFDDYFDPQEWEITEITSGLSPNLKGRAA